MFNNVMWGQSGHSCLKVFPLVCTCESCQETLSCLKESALVSCFSSRFRVVITKLMCLLYSHNSS